MCFLQLLYFYSLVLSQVMVIFKNEYCTQPEGENNLKIRKFAWPFIFNILFFAGAASFRPYLVLYYQSLSFTGTQIGLLTGITPLITLISLPLLTGFADRTKRHKLILSLSLLIAATGLFLFPYLKSFIIIFSLTILMNIFLSPVGSLSNSATMFMLGDRKDLYGRIRLGGTLGFSVTAAVVGALVEKQGLKIAFWSAAIFFLIAFLISQKLVHASQESVNATNIGLAKRLLKNHHFLLFLFLGFAGGLANALINTYLFPYMKSLGSGESVMGLALTIGIIAEIPILFFVSYFIKKYKPYTLILFSLGVTSLRFLMLAITTNPIIVLLLQLLNGFTFPLLTVAGITYADEQAPQGLSATSQGLFNASSGGIGSAVGGFAGGLLFTSIGGRGMYLVFFIFITLVLISVSIVHCLLPPEAEKRPLIQ